jgi:hypothetical protein
MVTLLDYNVWGRILEGDEKPGIQETEVERS